jgi:hypothetical protein
MAAIQSQVFGVSKARDSGVQPVASRHATVFQQLLQKYPTF